MEAKKVIIATESYIANQGFHLIFNKLRYCQVIDKAINFDGLVEILNQQETDIILISSSLFNVPGNLNKLIHQLGNTHPQLIAYLPNPDEVLENSNLFTEIIRHEDSKEKIIDILNKIVKSLKGNHDENESSEISEREKDILKQVALGHTNNEIAERLFISAHTVITHRKKITKKLGIKSVSGLTVYAIINGLVEMEDIGEKV